jgi:16S rRNA (cytidine1402-2'-O)-methyltransferase
MNDLKSTVYLIPGLLSEEAVETIPFYITEAVKNCQVFFVENERTARRYLKKIWRTFLPGQDIVIDDYEWCVIGKTDPEIQSAFKQKIKEGKNIGIISEAGCPGIADPGQELISIAREMASGMNGQRFQFAGYLPINEHGRIKTIKQLEAESQKKDCTQIFIETPYRNNQLIESILKTCKPATRFCVAVDLTGRNESIKTKTIAEWKKEKIDFHKRPAIFLLLAV